MALASQRGGILIALIVLPLLTPPVIFGGSAIARVADGAEWESSFALLCAYCVAAVGFAPFAMSGSVPKCSVLMSFAVLARVDRNA